MSKSILAQLGDQIVDLINSSHLAKAVRRYTPEVDLDSITRDPQVYIRSSIAEEPLQDMPHSRGARFVDAPYDLLLTARVDDYDIRDIDGLVGLYEDLDAFIYKNGRILNIEKLSIAAQWVRSRIDTTVNREDLRERKVVQVAGQIIYRYTW